MEKIKLFFRKFKRSSLLQKKKSYPRDYSIKELENEVDLCGNSSPTSHLGASYYARASLGLTELERRSASALGWSTFFVSLLALIFSIYALRYSQIQTELTELGSRSERISQLQSIKKAKEECRNNPNLKESSLFNLSTGDPALCSEVIR